MAILTIGLSVGVATPGWAASDDATWGVRAADNDRGTERQNFTYQAQPGETIDDTIEVTNHGTTPLPLGIYAADGFTTSSGQLDVLSQGDDSQEIGAWTTIDTTSLALGPGESAQVDFHLTVPKNASPGDYAGAIVSSLQTSQESGISIDRRLGIRIYLQVGGELAPALAVDEVEIRYDATFWPFVINPAEVKITVQNSGNARLSATQRVTTSGLFWSATTESTTIPELLPGERWSSSVDASGIVPTGHLSARVELLPARPDGQVEAALTTSVGVWGIPWLLLGLMIVIALVTVALVSASRRRRLLVKSAEEKRIADAVDAALHERDAADAG
jgi:uncharacterized membrane protein